ncbi:MAG: hypothetical protein GY753_09675 [Gammaproteobacteria bacterium]|nr:hypothetical protein [Gammaproteobacteria bacterium]
MAIEINIEELGSDYDVTGREVYLKGSLVTPLSPRSMTGRQLTEAVLETSRQIQRLEEARGNMLSILRAGPQLTS